MTCDEARFEIPAILSGEVVDSIAVEHVAGCVLCTAERDALAAFASSLQILLRSEPEPISGTTVARMRTLVREADLPGWKRSSHLRMLSIGKMLLSPAMISGLAGILLAAAVWRIPAPIRRIPIVASVAIEPVSDDTVEVLSDPETAVTAYGVGAVDADSLETESTEMAAYVAMLEAASARIDPLRPDLLSGEDHEALAMVFGNP